jgi:hypothetical protein
MHSSIIGLYSTMSQSSSFSMHPSLYAQVILLPNGIEGTTECVIIVDRIEKWYVFSFCLKESSCSECMVTLFLCNLSSLKI